MTIRQVAENGGLERFFPRASAMAKRMRQFATGEFSEDAGLRSEAARLMLDKRPRKRVLDVRRS